MASKTKTRVRVSKVTASKKATGANSKRSKSKTTRSRTILRKVLNSQVAAQAKQKAEMIDQILLKLVPHPYSKLLKSIKSGRKRMSEESQLAYELGSRILNKAKDVRDTLITKAGLK